MEDRKQSFWTCVEIKDKNECWPWVKGKDDKGYGRFWYGGKCMIASRLAAMLDGQDITGKCVLHTCDNPACVNPNHLTTGTQSENLKDMVSKGRLVVVRGSKNVAAKLVDSQVAYMKALRLAGYTQTQLAEWYQVSQCVVGRICRGESYSNVEAWRG